MYNMNITLPCVCVLSGKPKQGKSHLIKYFMYLHRKYFDYGLVFTRTKFNDGYKFLPQDYVHSDYDESILKNLMKLQANLIEEGTQKKVFIIFDDCLSDDFKKETFTNLITQHRHYNITVIISTQYIYKINPTIRECAGYAIIFRPTTGRSIDALYESFGSHFNDREEFKKYVIDNTGDFQFIFVDVNSQEDGINKIYKVQKAPENIPDFNVKYKLKK